jgi:predicted transglutaminase-like cysteine proteinase
MIKEDMNELSRDETDAAKKMNSIIDAARAFNGWNEIGNMNMVLRRSLRQQTFAEEKVGAIREWRRPLDAFRNENDCKGYAVVNYFGLAALGIPDIDRQIIIVENSVPDLRWDSENQREEESKDMHAVVAVRLGREWRVLDSLLHMVVPDEDFFKGMKRYWIPIIALDERGVWKIVRKQESAASK